MKTLNDSLRGELKAILDSSDFKKLIEFDELEMDVLNKAFDVLLRFKTSPDLLEKARGEFENYIINHLKSLKTDI